MSKINKLLLYLFIEHGDKRLKHGYKKTKKKIKILTIYDARLNGYKIIDGP